MRKILLLLVTCVLSYEFVYAQGIAKIDSIEGEVSVKLAQETEYKLAALGAELSEMDVIRTGRYGRTGIVFSDGFLLRLAENTTLQVQARPGEQKQIKIDSGRAFFFSKEPKEFPLIASPAVTTAIRGTEFVLSVTPQDTQVFLINGAVECYNDHGKVALSSGEKASARLGQAPLKSIILNPTDAVQWALSYPVILSTGDLGDLSSQPEASRLTTEMRILSERGKSAEALAKYDAFKGKSHPGLELFAANVFLSMGQTEKAQELLEKSASQLEAHTGDDKAALQASILAQRAIIALVKNEKDQAKSFVSEALVLNKNSRAAAISSAYISQSDTDLDGAAVWYKKLLELEPGNAFAYAKLAELELGKGDFSKATRYLKKAQEIDADNLFVMSIEAFLLLFKDKTGQALNLFEQILSRDSTMASARMGLGLAKVRKGDLHAGREELKRAAYLEPQVSIYRSYLGKAYFEEENETLASKEYERAIELDPLDPTPYLYRAYKNLSQNKPVAALSDVEKSIELNNNRAVYRSSFLLDQDLGVRGAGLAEVFTSLGFSEVARVEAIKSLNRNYTNYSAHRLLADSYDTIFLSDAAVSERRLAEILSPLSFNLFRQASVGSSLNEYNSLFDRNESRTEISGTFETGDDLINPGIIHAGKKDNFGYLFGFDGMYTGGSKNNNYSVLNKGQLALQYQPAFDHRFLLQSSTLYRHRKDDMDAFSETRFEQYDVNLAYTKRFSQNSLLIADAAYGNQNNRFLTEFVERFAVIEALFGDEVFFEDIDILVDQLSREKVESYRGTLQYLHDTDFVSFVLGTQFYNANQRRRENSAEIDDSLGFFSEIDYFLRSRGNNDVDSQDYYLYTTFHLTDWADLNLGTTYSSVELENREVPPFVDQTFNRHKLSPKFGVTLYPSESTTVRAAYFESLRKSSLEDVGSLEPTLVGGLNQRFTDFPGSKSRNYGVGIDQKLSSTYFGVEGLRRHKVDPISIADTVITVDFDEETIEAQSFISGSFDNHSRENIAKSYIYQVLSDTTVATLDYQWTGFSRDQDEFDDLETEVHKVAGGLRYFSPQRWFAFTTATWREQKRNGNFIDIDGSNDFWVLDAGVGYRLPKRHGSIVLQVNNILDRDFFYDQSLGLEPFVRPELSVALMASFNFNLFR